jgi:hypothetical protein
MFNQRMGDATSNSGDESSLAFGETHQVQDTSVLNLPLNPPIRRRATVADLEPDQAEPIQRKWDQETLNMISDYIHRSDLFDKKKDPVEEAEELFGRMDFGDNFLLTDKESRTEKYNRGKKNNGYKSKYKDKGRTNKHIKGRKKFSKYRPNGLEDDYPDYHDGRCVTCGAKGCTSHLGLRPGTRLSSPLTGPEPPKMPERPAPESKNSTEGFTFSEEKLEERNQYVHRCVDTPPQQPAHTIDPDEELTSLLDSIKIPEFLQMDKDAKEWVGLVENLAVFGYQLYRAQSIADVFVASVAYMKMHTQKSLIHELMEVINTLTTEMMEVEMEPQAWDPTTIRDRWDLFKNNPIYAKVSYLITAAMSMTVCSVKKIEWSPFGMRLLCLEAAEKQCNAVDVIDAMLHTFTWIAETGYQVIEERSLLPLLYSDQRIRKFNNNCDYILGNAEQVLTGNHGNIEDFEEKLDDVLLEVTRLKAARDSGTTAVWLQQRYERLVDVKHKIVNQYKTSELRFAPFGVGLTGSSGVGKSTLSKLVMKTALFAMGFTPDPRRIITQDMFDHFDSTVQSNSLGVLVDDVGQGKSTFVPKAVTDVLIKIFNNVAAPAVKAELNLKGMVWFNFKCGVLTSNLEDYDVRSYSNRPEAVLRRFVHTRVRVKPHLRISGGVSLDTRNAEVSDTDDSCKDIWELDLEECFIYENKKGKDSYRFRKMLVEIPTEDGKGTQIVTCKNMDLKTYLRVIITLARAHAKHQRNLLKRNETVDSIQMCEACSLPKPMCSCAPDCEKMEPNALDAVQEVVARSVKRAVFNYCFGWCKPVLWLQKAIGYSPIRELSTAALTRQFEAMLNDKVTPFLIEMTPECVFQTSAFQRAMTMWQHSTVTYDLSTPYYGGMSILAVVLLWQLVYSLYGFIPLTMCLAWSYTMFFWSHYRVRMRSIRREYLARRDSLPTFVDTVRTNRTVQGALALTTIALGIKAIHMWNKRRKMLPQGLEKEDIDKNIGWFGFMMQRMGVNVGSSESAKSASSEQVISTVKKSNAYWAEFIPPLHDKGKKCNIFFPRKSVAWFPHHIWYPNSDMEKRPFERLTIYVDRGKGPGSKFFFTAVYDHCVFPEHLDLCCCFVPNCPDLRDKTKWLPTSYPQGVSMCSIILRHKEESYTERLSVKHGLVGHKFQDNMKGGSYTTKWAIDGTCMAPLVLEQKDPVIVGFHIAGGNERGAMMTILKSDSDAMLKQLEEVPGVVLSANATDIPITQYERPLLDSKTVHPQAMAAHLEDYDFIDVLGSSKLRTMQKSTVTPSLLSEHVAEVCGYPNNWGKPKLIPNWKAYNETLKHIVNPAGMFWPDDLEKARQDWLGPLRDAMTEYIKSEDFRPLNDVESILGVEGKRFLDPLKMSTGAGFPMFGPKERLFTEHFDEKGKLVRREPVEELQQEMQRLYSCWERGERGYPVTSATLKDEPTPLDSEKVRVFQAVAVAFGIWIRKYFLPVARFLSLHPILSESAVGINAFSQEWETLMEHVTKFADDDQVIAWDYSKYDVRMNSQVTRAVLVSYIELAELGGYPQKDLYIMKMMIADLVHPLIDYNGTMIMAYNMNTSGNNITVNINSSGGSLYARLGFFHVNPRETDFRKRVAAMTYGDDFKGSVKKEYRNFNFFTYRDFLAQYGMKITPPDKNSEGTAFMNDKDADFLKRNSNYIPEIDCSIGKLDENSIFKSLHANLESKAVTKQEVAISCIECAMHEWFAFGREHYDMRAAQMKEVCRRANLPVPAVEQTFDERVAHWKEKYVESADT